MATDKVKRSLIATYINTTPLAADTWELLGLGITTGLINYNPQTTTETFIHQDTASISVDSYAPTMPIEAQVVKTDPAFLFIDGLRKSRAVLAAAETEVVNVWLYETPVGGAYGAEKQNVSIQIDSFGGDGGTPAVINFTINYVGDPVTGTFNPTTKVFT